MGEQPTNEWQKVFAGRDIELKNIVNVWDAVKTGNGPQLHVVRGERGMGKTRLVQEFYKYLSRNEDPENYWPDGSSFVGKNLHTGPDPDYDPIVGAHFNGFSIEERTMPYLWWGFRLAEINARNAIRPGLNEHLRSLEPHLQNAEYAKACRALDKGLLEIGKEKLQREGVSLGIEFVADIIPMASLVHKIGSAGIGVLKNRKKRQKLAKEFSQETIHSFSTRAAKDVNQLALNKLHLVLKEQGDTPLLPVILFVDDAQFAIEEGDIGTLRFLSQVWDTALEHNLPLLIIATHWDAEWLDGIDLNNDSCFASVFASKLKNLNSNFTQTLLTKNVKLLAMVQAGLPKLPNSDYDLILSKADGNPYLLQEIIKLIHDSESWLDIEGKRLSEIAIEDLESHSFEVHKLIVNRLNDPSRTPPDVRNAVVLASVLGMQFSQSVVKKAAQILGKNLPENVFNQAETPHRYVDIEEDNSTIFLQRATHEAANSLVRKCYGAKKTIDEALIDAVNELSTIFNKSNNVSYNFTSVRIALNQKSLNISNREDAAMELVRVVTDIYYDDLSTRDLAEAVRLVNTIERNMKDGTYDPDWFLSSDFAIFGDIKEEWYGIGAGVNNYILACGNFEKYFGNSTTINNIEDLYSLYDHQSRLAQSLEGCNDFENAILVYKKCIATGLKLNNIAPDKLPIEKIWRKRIYLLETIEENGDRVSVKPLWQNLYLEIKNYQDTNIDIIHVAYRYNLIIAFCEHLRRVGEYEHAVVISTETRDSIADLIENNLHENSSHNELLFFQILSQINVTEALHASGNEVDALLEYNVTEKLFSILLPKSQNNLELLSFAEILRPKIAMLSQKLEVKDRGEKHFREYSVLTSGALLNQSSPKKHANHAFSLQLSALNLKETRGVSAAIPNLKAAMEIYRNLYQQDKLKKYEKSYADSLLLLSACELEENQYESATSYFEEALSILRDIQDDSLENSKFLQKALVEYGGKASFRQDFSRAYAYYEEALMLGMKVLKTEPTISNKQKLSAYLFALGGVSLSLGKYGEPSLLFEDALIASLKGVNQDNPSTEEKRLFYFHQLNNGVYNLIDNKPKLAKEFFLNSWSKWETLHRETSETSDLRIWAICETYILMCNRTIYGKLLGFLMGIKKYSKARKKIVSLTQTQHPNVSFFELKRYSDYFFKTGTFPIN